MRECHQITLLQMTDILTRQNQTQELDESEKEIQR